MPRIAAVATAVPPYRVSQSDARTFASRIFSKSNLDIDRLLPVFDNAGIETRYFTCPLDWFGEEHSLEEKNHLYIESATNLGVKASREVLETAGYSVDDVDYIVYVNTTGLATPSIDARLINVLKLKSNIRRTPIWGLGCAGGAAGLAHAYHYLLGHPQDRVLLVAAEMCGLTFIPNDLGKSNLVATALFGEGAAAVLLTGDEVGGEGLDIAATRSRFYPDSLDVMGWNIISEGMQVVFAKRIPDIVAEHAKTDLGGFLATQNLTLEDIDRFLFHPGGVKVVEAYEAALGLNNGQLKLCREILRDFGNMSSVTVLFVLAAYFQQHSTNGGGYGLVSALGPGFCSESLLLRL